MLLAHFTSAGLAHLGMGMTSSTAGGTSSACCFAEVNRGFGKVSGSGLIVFLHKEVWMLLWLFEGAQGMKVAGLRHC